MLQSLATACVPGRIAVRSSAVSLLLLAAGFVFAASGCVLISGSFDLFSPEPKPLKEHVVAGSGRANILLIDVTPVISNEGERGAFGIVRRLSVAARVDPELEQAAVERVKARRGLKEARLVLYRRGDEPAETACSVASSAGAFPPGPVGAQVDELLKRPRFLYLWAP